MRNWNRFSPDGQGDALMPSSCSRVPSSRAQLALASKGACRRFGCRGVVRRKKAGMMSILSQSSQLCMQGRRYVVQDPQRHRYGRSIYRVEQPTYSRWSSYAVRPRHRVLPYSPDLLCGVMRTRSSSDALVDSSLFLGPRLPRRVGRARRCAAAAEARGRVFVFGMQQR